MHQPLAEKLYALELPTPSLASRFEELPCPEDFFLALFQHMTLCPLAATDRRRLPRPKTSEPPELPELIPVPTMLSVTVLP